MKISVVFILLFSLLQESEIFSNLTILQSDQNTVLLGYDDIDMATNGEAEVIDLIEKGIAFDVGANKGKWTQRALTKQKAECIYLFEPIPNLAKELEKHLPKEKTKIQNIALSDKNGTENFIYYQADSGLSTFYQRVEVESSTNLRPQYISVIVKTLDQFCSENFIDRICFLKIDTEGSEFDILKGSIEMLKKQSIDMIQFEYGGTYKDAGILLKDVYNYLVNLHYKIFRISKKGLISINVWSNNLENYQYSNYFAISDNYLKKLKV
jgi:FkbM family methyltransferase